MPRDLVKGFQRRNAVIDLIAGSAGGRRGEIFEWPLKRSTFPFRLWLYISSNYILQIQIEIRWI